MSTVKTGWLKNNDGEKFAPKTLMSQVMTNEGTTLESQLSVELDATLAEAKAYTDTMTSGIASTGVVDNKISAHDVSPSAHADIRGLVSELSTKVNNFLDVDDATTDQLSEIIEMINNNKGTLDSITSNKVNVSDIVDNLTTSNDKKVLSAKQGVALKALIDALQEVVNGKAAANHDHDDRYYTETEINTKIDAINDSIDKKSDRKHSHDAGEVSFNAPSGSTTPVARGTVEDALCSIDEFLNTQVASVDHDHAISDVTNLQSTLDTKASQTDFDGHTGDAVAHITADERTKWNAAKTHADSTHAPVDAQANVIESIKVNGTAQTITSKAVNITVPTQASDIGAAPASHGHAISEITDLQTTLNNAASAIGANTSSITSLTDRTKALEDKVGDGFIEITSTEIRGLFA